MSVETQDKYYIILCKNKKSAKMLFDRACMLSHDHGEKFKVDYKHLMMLYDPYFIIRFVSAIDYYRSFGDGYDRAVIINDTQFDKNLDRLWRHWEEKKDGTD